MHADSTLPPSVHVSINVSLDIVDLPLFTSTLPAHSCALCPTAPPAFVDRWPTRVRLFCLNITGWCFEQTKCGPQDQDTLTHALLAEQEWLATLSQKIAEVQSNMQQSGSTLPHQAAPPPSQQAHLGASSPQKAAATAPQRMTAAQPMFNRAAAADNQSESAESITSIGTASEAVDYILLDDEASDQVAQSLNLVASADDARHEAPARMQLKLAEELADDDHHLVTEQQHRHHRYTSGDIEIGPETPLISLAAAEQAGSRRTSRSSMASVGAAEAPWTLMSYKADPDQGVPLGSVPVGTLAEEAATLMKGVFAAGNGSVFQAVMPGSLVDNARPVKPHRLTAGAG